MTKSQQKKLLGAIIGLLVVLFAGWQVSQQTGILPGSVDYDADDRDPMAGVPVGYSPFSRVVDGDTIEVAFGQYDKYKVRLIGINAPESVDPRTDVQCFGKEASEHLKQLLNVPHVRLSPDPSQAGEDRYGRWLRFVYTEAGVDIGLQMIKDGYAYEYTYDTPYTKQVEYRAAQKEAQTAKRGLWSPETCNGKP